MKRIACIALLALLLANCKKNDENQQLNAIKNPAPVTSTVKKEEVKKDSGKKDEECKDINVEMGSGRECIIKNTDLESAYENIIKNKEVEESEYYLSTIPSENKSVAVDKNGLIAIDYKITKDKVEISMNYEGGVTEVTLEKIKNTIKKSIYHYAD